MKYQKYILSGSLKSNNRETFTIHNFKKNATDLDMISNTVNYYFNLNSNLLLITFGFDRDDNLQRSQFFTLHRD